MSVKWNRRRGNPSVATVDASLGNETLTLTPVPTGETLVVRRVDSSGNTLTVGVAAGLTLNGNPAGTATVAAGSERDFLAIDGGYLTVLATSTGGGGGAVSSVVGQTGAVTGTQILADSTVTAALTAKAPLASPALTGTPTAPTASALTGTTQLATTAYVDTADGLDLKKASNLSDLASAATARTNLGLGTAATVNAGTSSGNVPLLSTGGRLPIAQIASGTPDGTKFVRDDGTLVTPSGGGGGSGLPGTFVSRTTAYTALVGDFVLADATSAGFTVTLPASPTTGNLVVVKKVDSSANVVTVVAAGKTIDGDSNATIVSEDAGGVFEYDGTNWRVAAAMTASSAPIADGAVTTAKIADAAVTVTKTTGLAPLASPALTGIPTAPTASALTGTTQLATTAYVDTADGLNAKKASNLSDLASAVTARTNLGLGNSATLSVGTTAGTVAAGNDSRFTASSSPTASITSLTLLR